MSTLRATIIDVGWGDSILLESIDRRGTTSYGLIDCNDSVTSRSSHTFVKRFFERHGITIPFSGNPIFNWVLLTHPHADHAQGLKRILRDFGTLQFWYPDSRSTAIFFSDLIRFATRSAKVRHFQTVDNSVLLPSVGDAQMNVLWPPPGFISANENDNSVVLELTLGRISFVLTGDAEAEGVWTRIANQIPSTTRMFKVPHHGAENGTFDVSQRTPWIATPPANAVAAISSHIRPFQHPREEVLEALKRTGIDTYRTDEQYHLTFETKGTNMTVRYSH